MVNIDSIHGDERSAINQATDSRVGQFRQRVRREIEKDGWSIADLARESELSSHTVIHRFLRGEGVTLNTAFKLAMTLGVNIE